MSVLRSPTGAVRGVWVDIATGITDTDTTGGFTTPFGATPIDVSEYQEVLLGFSVTAITGGTMTAWGYAIDSYIGTTVRVHDAWNQNPMNFAKLTQAPTTTTTGYVWLQRGLSTTTNHGGAATGYAGTVGPGPLGTHILVRRLATQSVAPSAISVALRLVGKR